MAIWGLSPAMFGALMGLIGIIFKSSFLVFLGIIIFAIPIILTISIPTPLIILAIIIGVFLITRKK